MTMTASEMNTTVTFKNNYTATQASITHNMTDLRRHTKMPLMKFLTLQQPKTAAKKNTATFILNPLYVHGMDLKNHVQNKTKRGSSRGS